MPMEGNAPVLLVANRGDLQNDRLGKLSIGAAYHSENN